MKIIHKSDVRKLISISIVSACAVFVCTLFLNFYLDLSRIKNEIVDGNALQFYDAQMTTIKVICFITGGSLVFTAFILLVFYIKHYIDVHKKELGICKAMGYSAISIAEHFWIFALSVAVGTTLGFGFAVAWMPDFYALQNKDHYLPDLTVGFHNELILYLIVVPTVVFALLAIVYAYRKLKCPCLSLIREQVYQEPVKMNIKKANSDFDFLKTMRKTTLSSRKVLVFFVAFSSFCYASMTQMAFSMRDLSSETMGLLMLTIGLILAFLSFYLAVSTVLNANRKPIAMMRIFGYSQKECGKAILGGYRIYAYGGFLLGTIYQYGLLKLMVDIVFQDMLVFYEYHFNIPMAMISLISYMLLYEGTMLWYTRAITHISIKSVMLE